MTELERQNMNDVSNYKGVPAMTSPVVHEYLKELGLLYSGKGVVLELGCWLGGSALPLLEGLVKAGYNKQFYAFDRWIADKSQVVKAAKEGVKLTVNESTFPKFWNNVITTYSSVCAFRGGLPNSLYDWELSIGYQERVEIVIFDAPKQEPIFTGCMKKILPYCIPGVTVFGLLDYNFYQRHTGIKRKKFRAPVDFVEKYKNHFEVIKEWPDQCPVFLKYLKELKL